VNTFDPHTSLDEQAAYWFLRLRENDVEPDEIEAAFIWQSQSAAHFEAFTRVRAFWASSSRLPAPALPDIAGVGGLRDGGHYGSRGWAIAASIVLAVAVGGYLGFYQSTDKPDLAVRGTATRQAPVAAQPDLSDQYATAPGENRTIALADGSEVVLGGASTITVSYSAAFRRINLVAGEALFRVQKDAARPFLVDSAGGETQAVGTVFDVHRGVDSVTVTVVEGVVRVQPDIARVSSDSVITARLAAGHQVSYSPQKQFGPIKQASAEHATAWQNGELTFVDKSLADVVIDLNRYSQRPIVVDDEGLKSFRVTGMVTIAKMDEWLRAMEKNIPIKVVMTKDKIVLMDRSETLPKK
jgi:transmembrane sensor